ncbi:dinitrogenase iron-molybdenum cofactor [Thermococcus sp. M36]|uniref:NifB/NifX family molybdenum-iron cluster-binding protein n=1 Tax=Thermococcus sp. M36 TaxID=1638261 RepID=UPI00143C2A24|nr:NifB/NifX family molybdenum-iron cluster-binding protein [Thermococcus sp. M36]NJE06288.1 dinitrogenase iron-molybdenum cofactor [Thermococcus sp. M36]
MRIAVPAEDGRGLESNVNGHFGRAKYFVFVDVEEGEIKDVKVVKVPFDEHGTGDLPNFVKEHGGEVVLAYGMGQKAIAFFNQLGIEVVTGAYGPIKDVVKAFIKNVLEVDPYWKEKIEREKGHKKCEEPEIQTGSKL